MPIVKRKWRLRNGRLVQQGDKFKTYENCWGHAVFLCECGNRLVLSVSDVERGLRRSCGCMKRENAVLTKINKILETSNLSQYSLQAISKHISGEFDDNDVEKSSIYTYVLELTDKCWYVGRTSVPNFRVYTHGLGKTVPWITLHPVVGVHSLTAGDTERQLTLSLMRKYGWNNVRGSVWTKVDMYCPPKEI